MLYIYGFILKANSRHVPCPCLHRPAGHGADPRHAAVTGPHHLRWQQRRQLGTMEPPACSPVLVTTRVTETHSSSWKMAPSSHTCSFSLLRKGSQPQGSEDIDTSQAWAGSVVRLQCRTWEVVAVPTSEKQVRRESQKQLLSSLPACLPCDSGTWDGEWIEPPKLPYAPRCFSPTSPRSTCKAASSMLT